MFDLTLTFAFDEMLAEAIEASDEEMTESAPPAADTVEEPELPRHYETREEWLNEALTMMVPFFRSQGIPLPELVRVTCGFPAIGSLRGTKQHRIGECWSDRASGDGTTEIMISPVLEERMEVLSTLCHEACHAAAGTDCGHKGPFKTIARAWGLVGKLTATTAGPVFEHRMIPILEHLGEYPHAALDARRRPGKKQGTRLIKAECGECGYTVRVTSKWLALGAPICPVDDGAHGHMRAAGQDDESEEE